MNAPDFAIVERTFERRLRELNLSPRPVEGGVETGYDRLALYRLGAEVAEVAVDDPSIKPYVASVEFKAVLSHPSTGDAEILDRITLDDDTLSGSLERCANTYMDVTFPALRSLFEGTAAPGTSTIKLSSFTPSLGKAIRWELFTGQLQLINDAEGLLAERFKKQPPIGLVFDTLTSFLSEPRLHWCKLYGGVKRVAGLGFGCSIDGGKSAEGEAEMLEKFREGGEVPGKWEFRQFMVMRPAGDADEETTRLLRSRMGDDTPKKKWWSRLFGS